MTKLIYFVFLLLTIYSCKTYSEDEKKNFDKQIQHYLKKEKVDCLHSESGLYYKILKKGKGKKIQYTDNVSFTYKGKLINGYLFDNQTKPISFPVKELIAGWKEVLLKSQEGSEIFVVIPPHLGYGNHDLEDIPPNSILVFTMKIENVL